MPVWIISNYFNSLLHFDYVEPVDAWVWENLSTRYAIASDNSLLYGHFFLLSHKMWSADYVYKSTSETNPPIYRANVHGFLSNTAWETITEKNALVKLLRSEHCSSDISLFLLKNVGLGKNKFKINNTEIFFKKNKKCILNLKCLACLRTYCFVIETLDILQVKYLAISSSCTRVMERESGKWCTMLGWNGLGSESIDLELDTHHNLGSFVISFFHFSLSSPCNVSYIIEVGGRTSERKI